MSIIREKKVKALGGLHVMVESFDSANEVVEVSSKRDITDHNFHNMHEKGQVRKSWHGVEDFEEAQNLMKTGYQPTVDKFKTGIKANIYGQKKRTSFFNDVVGFQPIVPLALQGVPNCMMNSYSKPMKSKVVDVYYDMTASCSVSSKDIIEAGQKILAAILDIEAQGYRVNLYAIQSYSNCSGADILCTKVKNANTSLDLKRISFPLTHTAYFRVIGFDWYSRTPKGKYRDSYGRGLGYVYSMEELNDAFKEIFGGKCVVFSCAKVLNEDKEHLKEVMTNE